MIIQNNSLSCLIKERYSPHELQEIRAFLREHGTFDFSNLTTGLFPAAHLSGFARYTGYDNVWVRDNIHVAHAHYVVGDTDVAVKTVMSLLFYFKKYRQRWERIIRGEADPEVVTNRPHVRFNGKTLEELDEPWSHAQNDALGYFLWLYCKLAIAGYLHVTTDHWEVLGLFPLFFEKVCYWEDEDSGHWEEARKVEASSIGVVVGALEMMQRLMVETAMAPATVIGRPVNGTLLKALISKGRQALDRILPAECIKSGQERPHDSALLFLIYPMEVVNTGHADAILQAVETHLKGDYGIRRYEGDAFWCANYDQLVGQELRTADVSRDMSVRNALLTEGEEAQWCLFDPLISSICGLRYERSSDERYLSRQVHYFNRSLSQLTGPDSGFPEFLCPELYYLRRGRYVPNDVTPLLWTQANLMMALHHMERTAQRVTPVKGQRAN